MGRGLDDAALRFGRGRYPRLDRARRLVTGRDGCGAAAAKARLGRAGVACAIAGVAIATRVQRTLPSALPLDFPLRGGRFYVVQGGASWLLNYHHGNKAQRFALDLTKLSTSNRRAEGLLPADPTGYFIFGTSVISPCAGRVRYAQDGVATSAIPSGDVRPPAGNYVAIDCCEHRRHRPAGASSVGLVARTRGTGRGLEAARRVGRSIRAQLRAAPPHSCRPTHGREGTGRRGDSDRLRRPCPRQE